LKKELHRRCVDIVEERILAIKSDLASIEESRNNETKSSAGDKYETGRAMMQMEEEKSRMQLGKTNQLRLELLEIDLDEKHETIQPGSLIITDTGKYFISIGLGKVKMKDEIFYCISMVSPIGLQMRGKTLGDQINFGGKTIQIKNII